MYFFLKHFGKGKKGGHEITSGNHSGLEKVQGDLKKKDLLWKWQWYLRDLSSSLNTMHKPVPNFKPLLGELELLFV